MIKIALVGATGFVGSAILNEIIWRGHKVTAICREPKSLRYTDRVTMVKVNVLDTKELNGVFDGHDVIISAFNAGWTNPNLYHDFITGSVIIQQYAKKANVKRMIVSGGSGSLYITPKIQVVDSEDFPEKWRAGASAARDYLNYLRNERELDWCFACKFLCSPGTCSFVRVINFVI